MMTHQKSQFSWNTIIIILIIIILPYRRLATRYLCVVALLCLLDLFFLFLFPLLTPPRSWFPLSPFSPQVPALTAAPTHQVSPLPHPLCTSPTCAPPPPLSISLSATLSLSASLPPSLAHTLFDRHLSPTSLLLLL